MLMKILKAAVFGVLISSQYVQIARSNEFFPLTEVTKLKVDRATMKDVSASLGEADGVVPIPTIGQTAWIYFNAKQIARPKIVAKCDTQSKVMKSLIWNIDKEDKEAQIEFTKSLFPNAHFTKIDKVEQVVDVVKNYSYFYDKDLGLSLFISDDSNKLESISWVSPSESAPSRTSASETAKTSSNVFMPDSFFEELKRKVSNR